MDNKKICEILMKAKQLGTFSHGSMRSASITAQEFEEYCDALCEVKILRKHQAHPVHATGGSGNRKLITFEAPVEYTLIISAEECQALIDEYRSDI